MVVNKALEDRVHTLEKSMGTVVKAIKEIKTEIKQLVDNGNKQQSEEIEEILEKQKVINEIISRNVKAIGRIDIEIARREKEVSENEIIEVDQNDKEVEVKKLEMTKCRYYDKGFCKYRTKCRYSHPEQTCEDYILYGQCKGQNCPRRHPKQCKFWQNNQNSCKRNIKCDFLHVTLANEHDKNEAHKPTYKCVSCKNVWEDRNCLVKHVIHGHETFFCLNCEDWVQFKTDVYNPNWTLFDEEGYLKINI